MSARILVVEDDGDIRVLLATLLELGGFEVRTAADGLDGFNAAREWRPDVVVTALSMPGASGVEMIHMLKGGELAGVPVIVLTARQYKDQAVALAAGADSVLRKPVDFAVLLARIREVLPSDRA